MRWNRVLRDLDGSLYQSWEWGEYLKQRGWIPWRVLCEGDGRPQAALQILELRLAPLLPRLTYAPAGIAGSSQLTVLGELTAWLQKFLRRRRAIFLRIDPVVLDSDQEYKAKLQELGFTPLPRRWLPVTFFPRTTMVLNIRRTDEELLSGMRSSHRYYIRRAGKQEVQFEEGCDDRYVEDLHRVVVRTTERKRQIAPTDLGRMLQLRNYLLGNNQGTVILARHDGKVIAGLLVAGFGKTCHLLYAGFDWEYRGLYVTEALQWKAIQWAKRRGLEEYDMSGFGAFEKPREGDPNLGIYMFKQGFGTECREFSTYFDLIGQKGVHSVFRFLEVYGRTTSFRAFKTIRWIRSRM